MKKIVNSALSLILLTVLIIGSVLAYKIYYFNNFIGEITKVIPGQSKMKVSLECYIWSTTSCIKEEKMIDNYIDQLDETNANLFSDLKQTSDCMPREQSTGKLLATEALTKFFNEEACSHPKTFLGNEVYLNSVKGILLNLDQQDFKDNSDKIKIKFNNSLSNISENIVKADSKNKELVDILRGMFDFLAGDYIQSYQKGLTDEINRNQILILQIQYALSSEENFVNFRKVDKDFFVGSSQDHEPNAVEVVNERVMNCSDIVILGNLFSKITSVKNNECTLPFVTGKDDLNKIKEDIQKSKSLKIKDE